MRDVVDGECTCDKSIHGWTRAYSNEIRKANKFTDFKGDDQDLVGMKKGSGGWSGGGRRARR
jgi:hypothetical protein